MYFAHYPSLGLFKFISHIIRKLESSISTIIFHNHFHNLLLQGFPNVCNIFSYKNFIPGLSLDFSQTYVSYHTISYNMIFQMCVTHYQNLGFSQMHMTHHTISYTRIFLMYVPYCPNVVFIEMYVAHHTISYTRIIHMNVTHYQNLGCSQKYLT